MMFKAAPSKHAAARLRFAAAAPDLRGIADQIERAAKNTDREAQRAAKSNDPYDRKEMKEMYESDAADMRKVAKLVLAGKIKEAGRYAYNMDTATRDELPSKFWRLIDQGDQFAATSGPSPLRCAPKLVN